MMGLREKVAETIAEGMLTTTVGDAVWLGWARAVADEVLSLEPISTLLAQARAADAFNEDNA